MSRRITSRFNVYPTNSDYDKLRHLKGFRSASLSGSAKPKMFKRSLASFKISKSQQIMKIQDAECTSSKSFSLLAKALYKSFKTIRKVIFESNSFDHSVTSTSLALKKIFKNISRLETLSIVSFDPNNIKYLRYLKHVKLSLPETYKTSLSALLKIRHLHKLQQIELCISDEDCALTVVKQVQHQVKAKHCSLDITLMRTFWPYLGNYEALSHQSFKKVASVELDLAKLSPISTTIDHDSLVSRLEFLKYLYEPVERSRKGHKLVECINLPGLKLQIDPKEYNSPPKIYSLLKNFISCHFSCTTGSIRFESRAIVDYNTERRG